MTSTAVIWICIGGALVAILVLSVLRIGRPPARDDPGSRAEAPSGDAGAQGSAALDPDDERVAFADRRRYPATKWDPSPGAEPDDPDNAVDEDDRSEADRPRHPENRWERG